jgi:hypothetical protein
MDIEKSLIEYHKLSNTQSLDSEEKNRLKEIRDYFYPIFMTSRIKQSLSPEITIDQWLMKEAKQAIEINELIDNTDQLIDKSNNPKEYREVWMQNIFDALNSVNFESPKGGKWEISQFRDIYELIRYHITYDRGIYNFLNEKGLINTGICPITGEPTQKGYAYSFFGRSIKMSAKGSEISKQEDPDYDEKLANLKAQARVKNKGGCLGFIVVVIFGLLGFSFL